MNIELYDVNGSLVIKQQTEVFTNSHQETIRLLELPSGMYMVRIQNGEMVYTGKVLKQ
ncbi:MAG: T9SS type A sorting domain-containing protein [Bacteroidia bacterium]